jgi:predicted phage-related endonuclease
VKTLLTLSDGTDRDAWLAARVPVVTATQAAAIAGSHPYTKLIDVWNEKTDPDFDPETLRNRWLEERAEIGNAREESIIEWASEKVGVAFVPNRALLADADRPEYACTPDGIATTEHGVVLIEAKTTQQDWKAVGLPQHIEDQCQWQMIVTGAAWVLIAVERYEWTGRGRNKVATLADQHTVAVQPDERRQAFLLERVHEFEGWLSSGVAPESDLDLASPPVVEFDDDPETVAAKTAEAEDFARVSTMLAELAEVQERMKADADREKAIKAELRPILAQYDGRRVSLHGDALTVSLSRYWSEKIDTDALPVSTRRSITSWRESERMTFSKPST